MNISELKTLEGSKVEFLYRGKYRPFILVAVQNKMPCGCPIITKECVENHLIHGRYQGYLGEVFLQYDYEGVNKRHTNGFWTKRIKDIKLAKERGGNEK